MNLWVVRDDVKNRCFAALHCMQYHTTSGDGDVDPWNGDLFAFSCDEALRWLAEQEYVFGAILLTCACAQPIASPAVAAASENMPPSRKQAVPPDTHPLLYVASYVLANFPHWGSIEQFGAVWNEQARLLCNTASPLSQRIFSTEQSALTFASDFETGNLSHVEMKRVGAVDVFNLWVESDPDLAKRLWFRFRIQGGDIGIPIFLRLVNLAPSTKLYGSGMRPVWRSIPSRPQWRRSEDMKFTVSDDGFGCLSFTVLPTCRSGEAIDVAFCVPYSYSDLLCHIANWHYVVKASSCNIRFEERVLCRTLDRRKLHLLIITSQSESIGNSFASSHDLSEQPLTPHADFTGGKKVVLITGRVHPGEVTASHAVHGLIDFLLSENPCALRLREHFIFFVVPMLNPDGVARGYSRLDQNGNNLNRCYVSPTAEQHPTVLSVKGVFEHLQATYASRFFAYLDFHSHASQRRAFAFGNPQPPQLFGWNRLFTRLVGLHSSNFDSELCRFSRADMLAKEGTSRVLFGGALLHSYTIEVTHCTSCEVESGSDVLKQPADVGRACLWALSDYCCLGPSARLAQFGGLEKILAEVRRDVKNTQK